AEPDRELARHVGATPAKFHAVAAKAVRDFQVSAREADHDAIPESLEQSARPVGVGQRRTSEPALGEEEAPGPGRTLERTTRSLHEVLDRELAPRRDDLPGRIALHSVEECLGAFLQVGEHSTTLELPEESDSILRNVERPGALEVSHEIFSQDTP